MKGSDFQESSSMEAQNQASAGRPGQVIIVGAGPSGLYLAFQLGLLDIACTIVDSLPEIGGQCYELYGDKPIFDIPGFESVRAFELVQRLWSQAQIANPRLCLNTLIGDVSGDEKVGFRLSFFPSAAASCDHASSLLNQERFAAVFVASGVGAFAPKRLRLEAAQALENSQLWYGVLPSDEHSLKQKRILISGGGRRAMALVKRLLQYPAAHAPASIDLIARSGLRTMQDEDAEPSSLILSEALRQGRLRIHQATIRGLCVDEQSGRLVGIDMEQRAPDKSGLVRLPADHLLICHGLSPKTDHLLNWELGMRAGHIPVDPARFETRRQAIFAIGDIASYPGKKKLIVSGFHEACLAAYASCDYVYPGKTTHLQYTTTSPRLLEKFAKPLAQAEGIKSGSSC
ncbi:MAG: NAD(P)/FAD-dependent oxidoreductase [Betaproteobacteria bacterium]|nr:NAD(P)/FAD-dependent oxidoreductase [Betaproteobacteria bacterium]